MRLTEDFYSIPEDGFAYEIMYQYINPEVSEPYPAKNVVSKIPKETKIWKEESNCWKAISKLNKTKSNEKSKQEVDS